MAFLVIFPLFMIGVLVTVAAGVIGTETRSNISDELRANLLDAELQIAA